MWTFRFVRGPGGRPLSNLPMSLLEQAPHRVVLHGDVQIAGGDGDVGVAGGVADFGQRSGAVRQGVRNERVAAVMDGEGLQALAAQDLARRAKALA